MTEKLRKCLDKGGISGAILTDFSKAFDCILYNLLIAKLAAFGFQYQSFRIMESFLSNRQQRIISISVTYFFLDIIECDIVSYALDNAPYNFDFSLDNVISNLEKSTNPLLNWFRENRMKASTDKCQLLVRSYENCTAKTVPGKI